MNEPIPASPAAPSPDALALDRLLDLMARLRAPNGCPWDREQTPATLKPQLLEECYEVLEAIDSGSSAHLTEELGDLLLQVVFHSQLAQERGAFDFEKVTRALVDKLIRRHPHVFGTTRVKNIDEVWANWEKIKRAEKQGTHLERKSVFDGIPRHLTALLRAEKLVKKAHKAKLGALPAKNRLSKTALAQELFKLAAVAQANDWSAEELLAPRV